MGGTGAWEAVVASSSDLKFGAGAGREVLQFASRGVRKWAKAFKILVRKVGFFGARKGGGDGRARGIAK